MLTAVPCCPRLDPPLCPLPCRQAVDEVDRAAAAAGRLGTSSSRFVTAERSDLLLPDGASWRSVTVVFKRYACGTALVVLPKGQCGAPGGALPSARCRQCLLTSSLLALAVACVLVHIPPCLRLCADMLVRARISSPSCQTDPASASTAPRLCQARWQASPLRRQCWIPWPTCFVAANARAGMP